MRKLLTHLLNLFAVFFLFDGFISFFDDFLRLFFQVELFHDFRNFEAGWVSLLIIFFYFLMGITTLIPKKIVLPPILFFFIGLMGASVVGIYFKNAEVTSLVLSVIQMLAGGYVFYVMKKMSGGKSWFLEVENLPKKAFSWKNLFGYIGINILLIPIFVFYFMFSIVLIINQERRGFVSFDWEKISSAQKEYVKDDKKVYLVGMVHVGESEFYKELIRSFPAERTVLLEKGVINEIRL